MAAINELIHQIQDEELRRRIEQELDKITKQKKFGLVFEEHLPECVPLYDVKIRRGAKVALKTGNINKTYTVTAIEGEKIYCIDKNEKQLYNFIKNEVVCVAEFGEPIYPYLQPLDAIYNSDDPELPTHTLIQADNYHALQLLEYLYAEKVDCIYIDPPYNTGARDWKYNNDYVDSSDTYRHSKWLSMMKKRLLLAKKLLNPDDSVLIVTIDEKEYLHLGCLLEELFPDARIQMVSSIVNPKGVSAQKGFRRADEYLFFVMFGESAPIELPLGNEWMPSAIRSSEKVSVQKKRTEIGWTSMMRRGSHSARSERPGLYYAIYADPIKREIVKIGAPIPKGVHDDVQVDGLVQILPIRTNGDEGCWQVGGQELQNRIKQGRVRLGKETSYGFVVSYLSDGEYKKVLDGVYKIEGYAEDGSLIAYSEGSIENKFIAPTQWKIASHDASAYGSTMLQNFFASKRFMFPKSLYAVHDALRFFVANKQNALIVDFFAGSGTTLHAVNLLNAEDGGKRQCVMVTNNEVSDEESKQLRAKGFNPGDAEWEKLGIANYVTWPRIVCSTEGHDLKNSPLEDYYITYGIETHLIDRRYTQINYVEEKLSLKQKKSLVTLLNKQKEIKLPTIKDDVPFLVSEENNSCNASILFDTTFLGDWIDILQEHNEITDLYIVTKKDSLFRNIKKTINEQMGQIEESIPIKIPMANGFKSNTAFFKLSFLDKTAVALGRQFKEMLPLLWLKAGAWGKCPSLSVNKSVPKMMILPENKFAILADENCFSDFEVQVHEHPEIQTVYLITDFEKGFKAMSQSLKVKKTYQLYRDYLDNFRINTERN